MRARIMLGFCLWLWVVSGPSTAAAERPLRLCLPPAATFTSLNKLTAAQRLANCLSLAIRERLQRLPGVEVMSAEWAAALFFAVQCEAGANLAPDFASFRRYAPVDAILLCETDAQKPQIRILTAKGAQEVPQPANGAISDWLRATAEHLAAAMGWEYEIALALGESNGMSAPMLEACLLSQCLAGEWVTNSGEARLNFLRPYIGEVGKYPMLIAAILRAGVELSRDGRKPENAARCVEMLRLALVSALGTAAEEDAIVFLSATSYGRETLAQEICDLLTPLVCDAFDEEIKQGATDDILEATEEKPKTSKEMTARAISAIKCLALAHAEKFQQIFPRLAAHENAALRAAAAYALANIAKGSEEIISRLAADKDGEVAFAAHYCQWRRGKSADTALALARKKFDAGSRQPAILSVIAEGGTSADEPRLRCLLYGTMAQRRLAFGGLRRLHLLTNDDMALALESVDETLLSQALAAMTPKTVAALRERLCHLANQPHQALAEAARLALGLLRPTALRERLVFNLEVEHLYLRLRAVEELAKSREPWATDLLLQTAAENQDPQVRAQALLALAEKSPEAALGILPRLLTDKAIWVRVHAAALAAKMKSPAIATTVAAALASEKDQTCRLYLEQFQGKAAPEPVKRFDAQRGRFGMCGYATHADTSPFAWYYNLNPKIDEAGRRAAAAGKIIIARANETAKNPGQVIFHPIWRDLWWLNLRREFADRECLAGLVLGEESMYAKPWSMWDMAWRCFCVDAGIDPHAIAGDKSKLDRYQTRAYLDWEQDRAIDGFNRMYDFIKMDFGAQQPNFLVCTFMPDQNGPNIAEHRWKFDIGGAYWYETNNRVRYNMIRRYRTVWPERPLIWLVAGNAALPWGAPVNYRLKTPAELVLNRSCKAYADAVCAWAAGATPGYFVAWLFMAKDVKPGPNACGQWVWLEDLAEKSEILDKAVDNVWKGVDSIYRQEADLKRVKTPESDIEIMPTGAVELELEAKDEANDEFSKRTAAERKAFRLGFFLEQKALYDIARAITDLPRPPEAFQALLVADRGGLAEFAGVNGYDVIHLINQIPLCKLDRYCLIGIAADPAAPLRDATIAALSAWLRDKPGLLYVRNFLCTDNQNEASTAKDHDGQLQEDWPWEADIDFAEGRYMIKGANAKALAEKDDACQRALWRRPDMKGAVIFDSVGLAPADFQTLVNSLHAERSIGMTLAGAAGMIKVEGNGITACASDYHACQEMVLPGIDLYTGEANPKVAHTCSAAITAENFRSTFVASYNSVTVLCDAPIEDVKPVTGGLAVKCAGLIRASSAQGDVAVKPDLPKKEGKSDEIIKWLLFGKDKGWTRLPVGAGSAVFVRSEEMIALTAK